MNSQRGSLCKPLICRGAEELAVRGEDESASGSPLCVTAKRASSGKAWTPTPGGLRLWLPNRNSSDLRSTSDFQPCQPQEPWREGNTDHLHSDESVCVLNWTRSKWLEQLLRNVAGREPNISAGQVIRGTPWEVPAAARAGRQAGDLSRAAW